MKVLKRGVSGLLLVGLVLVLSNCPLFVDVPSEIIGSWNLEFGPGSGDTWTFDAGSVTEAWYGQAANGSWTAKVTEVYAADHMLKTEDDMYISWQVIDGGTQAYIGQTNPGDSRPSDPATLYQGSSPWTKQ
jgi:hypothetical protein